MISELDFANVTRRDGRQGPRHYCCESRKMSKSEGGTLVLCTTQCFKRGTGKKSLEKVGLQSR